MVDKNHPSRHTLTQVDARTEYSDMRGVWFLANYHCMRCFEYFYDRRGAVSWECRRKTLL